MSRRSFQVATWQPTLAGTADGAVNIVDNAHMSIGATSTTGIDVWEIYVGGQGTATGINILVFARNLQLGSGTQTIGSAGTDGPVRSLSAAALTGGVVYTTAATNKPQRTNATNSGRLNLTHNAFGGIVRWFANPGEQWGITGVTVSISESSLSNF